MESVMNGTLKPADAIARGPHIYLEAEKKYKETPYTMQAFPRELYHQTEPPLIVNNDLEMEGAIARGFQKAAFPAKPLQPESASVGIDLNLLVLQQIQKMDKQNELIEKQGEQIKALMADKNKKKDAA